MVRTILAAGGAETDEQKEAFARLIIAHTQAASGKSIPTVCYLGQAGGETKSYTEERVAKFEALGCRMIVLSTFWGTEPFAKTIDEADGFFVPGGSTANLLLIWQGRGLVPLLRAAYEQGKVFAGYSAGAMCWFEYGHTTLMGPELISGPLPCLGWLQGSMRPHYDTRPDKAEAYRRAVAAREIVPGIALDDGAVALYENEKFKKFIAVQAGARAFKVTASGEYPL
jgi:peptidase E